APSAIQLEASLSRNGKELNITVNAVGDVDGCVYSLYAAKSKIRLEASLESGTIVADRTASSNSESFSIKGLSKVSKDEKGSRIPLIVSSACGLSIKNSDIINLKLKKSAKGLKSRNAWIKKVKRQFIKTNDDTDLIATSCSKKDNFTLDSFGEILNSANVGVATGTVIADSSSFINDEGVIRKYFIAGGQGLRTATSTDGVNYTPTNDILITEGNVSHQKVFKLNDGRLRIYTGDGIREGIVSFISTDELTFTREDGVRISEEEAGLSPLSHLSIIPLKNGTYRGYFSNLPKPGDPLTERYIKSATSVDLAIWRVDDGIRIGQGASHLTDPAEQPFALARGKRGVTLFYFKATGGEIGLYYSTSADGLKFSKEFFTGINGNGPDGLRLSDGSYMMYYDSGTEEAGFSIMGSTLSLDSD
ncbi:MAG: hypothetical protein KDD56_06875, partial [Bdellovibrionales bacterium]|nr:hypothetical protein [Bdellovibrionales bacterium]